MLSIFTKKRLKGIVETLLFLFVLFLMIGGLWLYSGQSFPKSSPLAVVESGSMIHEQSLFGRIGTIDPGDIIIVKKSDQIKTWAGERSLKGSKRYGGWGDVVVYSPNGNGTATPIIHRAYCWVEVSENGYQVNSFEIENESTITIPELGLYHYQPIHSGFITKGDNNPYSDQSSNICSQPVKPSWIIGKAQGEIPWIGLLKLIILGNPSYAPKDWVKIGNASAPLDQWICFFLFFVIIIGVPTCLDRKFGKK
jgi:signal peptidase